jgi:hypothetical protein
MEAVIQPIFGTAGFFANAFAVPVLCRSVSRGGGAATNGLLSNGLLYNSIHKSILYNN